MMVALLVLPVVFTQDQGMKCRVATSTRVIMMGGGGGRFFRQNLLVTPVRPLKTESQITANEPMKISSIMMAQ